MRSCVQHSQVSNVTFHEECPSFFRTPPVFTLNNYHPTQSHKLISEETIICHSGFARCMLNLANIVNIFDSFTLFCIGQITIFSVAYIFFYFIISPSVLSILGMHANGSRHLQLKRK